MALKDRLRRAMGRSEPSPIEYTRSTSTINRSRSTSTPTSTPTSTASSSPPITLIKTTSSRLSKRFTFQSKAKREAKSRQRLEDWERRDAEEWNVPTVKRPGRKSQHHQDILRTFEWQFGRKSRDGVPRRSASIWSGISPGTSMMETTDEGGLDRVLSVNRSERNGRAGQQVPGNAEPGN
ncbi:uncharacterized protein BP5553_03734 [Venustampulla echinocandica]|uniref:Uncharacterized protein n=1 Tax=Venustampulla echinocandica TaxID=2656787 RepID=A0A370TV33_9HELO|nr:uncharacterized protein BP5553_03734 [Venustampulla echinocandica]RDL39394.1 hypothetical protein BP5553_03734 [Venustampulla echinocandica]